LTKVLNQKGEMMKYSKNKIILPLLLVTLCILLAGTAIAVETGYVVGRAFVKLDGYKGHYREMIQREKIEIAYVKDNKQTTIVAETDDNGYFFISNLPLDGFYRVYKIDELNSIVPAPNPSRGLAGMLYVPFSSGREGSLRIIDTGETIISLKAGGKFAIERKYYKKKGIIDLTNEKPVNISDGNYGYPGLEYFARSGSGQLRLIAREAIKDRQAFARAEPLKKGADELKKHDKNAAIEKYRAAIKTYSAYEDAYKALASVLKDQKKKEMAIQVLETAQRLCPTSDDVKFELGKLYVETDQALKAVLLLEGFLKNNTDNLSVYENLAKAYHAANRQIDADRLWQKAVSTVKSENRFKKAADFYEKYGAFDKAIPLYQKNLTLKPDDRSAYKYLANAYVAAGNLKMAENIWEQGLQKVTDTKIYNDVGDFYKETDQKIKAIIFYEKYVESDPKNVLGYMDLADAYVDVDRYEDGYKLWQQGLREVEDEKKYYFAASFYMKAGDKKLAIQYFKKYADLKRDNNWAKIYLIRAYIAGDRATEALKMAIDANKALIYYNTYTSLMNVYHFDEAKKMLSAAANSYSDTTLSMELKTLKKKEAQFDVDKKVKEFFLSYLKTIQEGSDYNNWNDKPYDLYIESIPYLK
jgi:tetratricopeptide (TPR) repeat protein